MQEQFGKSGKFQPSKSEKRVSEARALLCIALCSLISRPVIVIAIIGVLVALLLPDVQAARESARRTQCVNGLRQVAVGMQNYHDAKKQLPAGNFSRCWRTWQMAILPYRTAATRLALSIRPEKSRRFAQRLPLRRPDSDGHSAN